MKTIIKRSRDGLSIQKKTTGDIQLDVRRYETQVRVPLTPCQARQAAAVLIAYAEESDRKRMVDSTVEEIDEHIANSLEIAARILKDD